ncbi:hypothetical protein [Teredinibacter purpureus]|jgi:hypothetical protein|uniref:hypothetical protein n=1 Tax=Teredinibacter purpureus TaxID=2731756 RepID=UPI0005F7DF27|nr:hypothetical protein [Teredinibacter purpureus]
MNVLSAVKIIGLTLVVFASTAYADDLAIQLEEMTVMGAVKNDDAVAFEAEGTTQETVLEELPVITE